MPPTTGFISNVVGGALVGLTVAVATVSFAVIAYGNSLPTFLDRGITLALFGSAVAAVLAGLYGSLRGVASHAQDATALLFAGAIGTLVAGMAADTPEEVRFATVIVLVATGTFLTGAFCFYGGMMRLGFTTRFMPYPVIAGLIASIGYLLSIGSVGLMVDGEVNVFTIPELVAEGALKAWWPWAVVAAFMIAAQTWIQPNRVLPIAMGLGLAGFYLWLLATGNRVADAENDGLLLGPFPGAGSLDWISPSIVTQADWDAVLRALPVVIALGPLTAISGILNIQAIAQATRQDHDLDRDLRSIGLSNLAASVFGGLVAYPAVSTTTLGAHLKISPPAVWIGSASVCIALAYAGTGVLALLPRGLFAMIVLYLGLSLLRDALWKEARRLPARDLLPVLVILLTTMFLGVLPALLVGITVSFAVFVFSYARLPFIRTDTTLALRRSIVERAEPNHALLNEAGRRVRILELTGSLFFGTAFALRQMIREGLLRKPGETRIILIDFRSVRDVDASAISSLHRTLGDCAEQGVQVCFSGLHQNVKQRLRRFIQAERGTLSVPRMFESLDEALQTLESEVLAEHYAKGGAAPTRQTFLSEVQQAVPELDLSQVFPTIEVDKDETIIEQGATSSEIYILLDGGAAALVGTADQTPLVVARFEPGALIGEMAFYQGAHRSATVVAEEPSRLIRVDADRMRSGSDLPDALVSAFHQIAARHLSHRLGVATKLLRNALP